MAAARHTQKYRDIQASLSKDLGTVAELCEKHEISPSSFYLWRRQKRDMAKAKKTPYQEFVRDDIVKHNEDEEMVQVPKRVVMDLVRAALGDL